MTADIPLIDFGAFLHGTDDQKEQTAHAIDDAFRNAGFVYLKNHGVNSGLVEQCFAWSKKFFTLPLEKKMLAPHPPGGSHHRGWSAPGLEKVAQHEYDVKELSKLREKPDCKESFESGHVDDITQPNIWPPEEVLPGFQPFMERYFTECAGLVHNILDALSIALSVPQPGLSARHSQSLFQLRLLHYPAISTRALKNKERSRINAHSDFASLTLLFQDSVGGLEVEDPNHPGVFRAARPIDNTVLVNIGDLMMRWSNDRWRSSIHRVGLPEAMAEKINGRDENNMNGAGDNEADVVPSRYSIPFFASPNPGTVIEALPGCWGEDNPRKYESVTSEEHIQKRVAALYQG